MMTVSAIQKQHENSGRDNKHVNQVTAKKNGTKLSGDILSYQALQQKALLVYQR